MRTRLIIIGVGGASCSGKTTLSKHIARVLPSSLIIHQDDFCRPSEAIPVHAEHGVQDWDDPDTAIEWPRMQSLLTALHSRGLEATKAYKSYDYLNAQVDLPVPSELEARWRATFDGVRKDKNEQLVFVLVDGFILFYDDVVMDELDVKMMLRVPRAALKARRESRETYVLQHEDDAAAGGVWTDPPHYFDNIVYPAYIKAHRALFIDGNVEDGSIAPVASAKGVNVVEPKDGEDGMGHALDQVCTAVHRAVLSDAGVLLDV